MSNLSLVLAVYPQHAVTVVRAAAMLVMEYAHQYIVDHALDGVFPTCTRAITPCDAHVCVYRSVCKYIAKAHAAYARGMHVPTIRVGNSAAKKAEITARDAQRALGRIAEKAVIHEAQQQGISVTTMLARKAQGSAQRAVNAMRVLARMVDNKPAKESPIKAYLVGVSDTPILGKLVGTHTLAAQYKSTHVVHATSGTKVADVRGEIKTSSTLISIRKANDVAAKAAAWALKQERIAMRRERIARMCAKAWMDKGVWIDTFLVEACNDSDYGTREAAYTELLAIIGVAA